MRVPLRMKLTKNPVFLHYFSKFMGILLFALKYIDSLLLKMINGWVFLTSKNRGQSIQFFLNQNIVKLLYFSLMYFVCLDVPGKNSYSFI